MTYLDSNMNLLKEFFPDVCKKISTFQAKLDQDNIRLITNKQGISNIQVGKLFLHEEENPFQEGKTFIENQQGIKENSDILFYGIGLGYHFQAFLKQYPSIAFSIYEPDPNIFYYFLCHNDLTQIPRNLIRNIFVEIQPIDVVEFCNKYVKTIRKSGIIIELPAYKKIFPQKRQHFFSEFEQRVQERSVSINILSAFEKRWTLNSIKNFPELLKSHNILLNKKDYFINKPAILVASGPSLDAEIENLRQITKDGLAYVFSVGTALNALIKHDIYPHAACTYDPTEKNQIICKEALEKNINSIPLIFGSTVGYETLEAYPGPKMHMLISQDTLAAFYLKTEGQENIETIHDATTISVITLQLLVRLKFNPIILVGQNFAYLDKKVYADGATFHPVIASQLVLNNAFPVKDVYGSLVLSNSSFNRMRQQFEFYLSHHKSIKFINTTKFGAHIEGTEFQNLEDMIRETLQTRLVEDDLSSYNYCNYDMEYLINQKKIMLESSKEVIPLLEKCCHHLNIINELATCRDPVKINNSYEQFNYSMDKLRNNQFFTTFITPMNRVELEFLMLAIPSISAERDPITKAKIMEENFRPFLKHCKQDIIDITPPFQELNNVIQRIYVQQKACVIKVLLIDVDGILTDGKVYHTSSGETYKQFHYKDYAGFQRLKRNGIITILVNNEDSVLEHIAKKMDVEVVSLKSDKKALIDSILSSKGLNHAEIACLFNDNHLDLNHIGLSFAVKNSPMEHQNKVDYVLEVDGGQGVIHTLADLITPVHPFP